MYECLARLLISSTTDDLPTLYSELNQLSNQVFDNDQYIDAFEDLFIKTNFQNLVQTSVLIDRYYKLPHGKILAFIHGDSGNPIYALPCHVYPKSGRILDFYTYDATLDVCLR